MRKKEKREFIENLVKSWGFRIIADDPKIHEIKKVIIRRKKVENKKEIHVSVYFYKRKAIHFKY